MNKQGFTLAEMLITVGLIGVIAALTLPGVIKNNQNKVLVSTLQSVVQSVEQALTNMVTMQNADSLFETTPWVNGRINTSSSTSNKDHFVAELGKYFVITSADTTANAAKNYYGSIKVYGLDNDGSKKVTDVIGQFNDCIILYTKSGAVIFIRAFDKGDSFATGGGDNISESVAFSRQTSLTSNPADIFIDVNGKSKPNTVGRDLFHFYIGPDGILYPYGGKAVGAYEGHQGASWNGGYADYQCTDTVKGNNGWGCTARLIDEGYQMKY